MSKYINYLPVLTYNALINIIVTLRETGKTFTAELWLIKRFLKTGKKFIWVRRTAEELQTAKQKFFKKKLLKMCGLAEDDVKIKGKYGYIRRGRKWVDFVEFCALSQSRKERSVDDDDYNIMIVDEAFATPSQVRAFVGDEVDAFNDLFISKKRDHDMRVFILGNKEIINNLYYDYFNIPIPYPDFEGVRTYRGGELLIYIDNKTSNFGEDEKRLKRLYAGTKYGAFLFDGAAHTQPKLEYIKKPKKAHFYACIDFGRPVMLWRWQGKIFVDIGVDVSRTVFVSRETMGKYPRGFMYDTSEKARFSYLSAVLSRGKVFYASPLAAELGEMVFLKMGIIK